jgi:hypothetical protein
MNPGPCRSCDPENHIEQWVSHEETARNVLTTRANGTFISALDLRISRQCQLTALSSVMWRCVVRYKFGDLSVFRNSVLFPFAESKKRRIRDGNKNSGPWVFVALRLPQFLILKMKTISFLLTELLPDYPASSPRRQCRFLNGCNYELCEPHPDSYYT